MNITDFYITGPDKKNFNETSLIEDDLIRIIIQKYEMIIFTEKGEVLCDPDFGGDITKLLYETKVSKSYVENELLMQIQKYIPELQNFKYSISVDFFKDKNYTYDCMIINFTISDISVYTVIS